LPFEYECDHVNNYKYYKPEGNSDRIQNKYENLPRKYNKSSQKLSNLPKNSQNSKLWKKWLWFKLFVTNKIS